MDREAVVIREEMSHTRAELDRKLTLLEARAHELSPSVVAQRYMPDYFADRMLGALLAVIGLRLAWTQYRRQARRERIRTAMASYGRW
jgi:hypothetical protein